MTRASSRAGGDQSGTILNNLGHQAQVPGFVSADEVAGQHHLEGTAGADQTRQEVGGGHVAAADAHVGIEAGEASGLGADTDVGAHSQREATASGDVVDQGDPGLGSLSNVPLQLAQLDLIVIETGDGLLIVGQTLLDVQAGAEALGLVAAVQQDDADVVVLVNQPLGQVGQVLNQAVGQSVVSLGSVQGDLQDVGLDHLEQQVLIRGQLSGCRINRLHDKILHYLIVLGLSAGLLTPAGPQGGRPTEVT